MLKSLQIRRLFLAIDLVLALGLAYVGYLVVEEMLSADDAALVAASLQEEVVVEGPKLASVESRGAYDAIVTSNLFGPAGRTKGSEEPPPPAAPVEVETALPLSLIGTSTAGEPTSPFCSAIIRHNDSRKTETYFIGQEVLPEVSLKQVLDRSVLLDNQRTNQIEHLFMEGERDTATLDIASTAEPPPTASFSTRVSLDKQEVLDDLFTNYAELSTKLQATLYMDERGNTAGVVAPNWSAIPLARKLNLEDGDVIQSVNNEVIDGENKIMELMTKYRDASTFRLGILRDGKPRVMTVTLR
jgi:type II secretory pathway component PulC